jgi:hypothetical protein
MAISKYFDRVVSLKTNNVHARLSKRSKMKLGLYFYKSKSKEISNLNYTYFANLFSLFSNVNPSMHVEEKNKAFYYSIYYTFKPNTYSYRFFSSNFLKYYPSETVNLIFNQNEIRFMVNNHITIFKNLRKYNKEMYDEKFDNPFVLFLRVSFELDKRLKNIIF